MDTPFQKLQAFLQKGSANDCDRGRAIASIHVLQLTHEVTSQNMPSEALQLVFLRIPDFHLGFCVSRVLHTRRLDSRENPAASQAVFGLA